MIDDAAVGGGQRHLLALAEGMDRARFEVAVACEGEGYLADQVRDLGLPFFPVRLGNNLRPAAYRACLSVMRRFRPQIVHTHGGTAGFYGRLSAGRLGIATVHTYHGLHSLHSPASMRHPTGRVKRLAYRMCDRLLAARTSALLCVSQSDWELAVKKGLLREDRGRVIPNGIDLEAFDRVWADRRRRVSQTGPENAGAGRARETTIGTVGRLNPEKGHLTLVQAMPAVLREVPNARFVIIGEGPERDRLEKEAAALDVAERLSLPGAGYDIPLALSRMDLFVFPSYWEGMPLAPLEAMASGLAVVGTRVHGLTTLLEDGVDSLVVPPADPGSLARALICLALDPNLAADMGRRGREKVAAHYDARSMIARIEAVYLSVST